MTAIEANTRAYLKCLIAKELLDMSRLGFLLGDFMEYLRGDPDHVDVCFASGVLYHVPNPVETLALRQTSQTACSCGRTSGTAPFRIARR